MRRPQVEHRNPRAHTRARDVFRRQIAEARAQAVIDRLAEDLQGLDGDTVLEVCRAIIRKISGVMATRDIPRSIGILAGAVENIAPAYRPEREGARQAGDAAFGKAAA